MCGSQKSTPSLPNSTFSISFRLQGLSLSLPKNLIPQPLIDFTSQAMGYLAHLNLTQSYGFIKNSLIV